MRSFLLSLLPSLLENGSDRSERQAASRLADSDYPRESSTTIIGVAVWLERPGDG